MPSRLFSPFTLRGVTFPNRIAVAPMCQYSATDGVPNDWHFVHLGNMAMSGASLVIVEATGVEPQGRITASCTGLYDDAQEAAFARIFAFFRSVSPAKIGIQLGHAGRKASAVAPWLGGGLAEEPDAWRPDAPSAERHRPDWTPPAALDEAGIQRVVAAFGLSAARAARLGCDYLEIHAAHGYLLHQFLSPLANTRNDRWGGDLAGRMRFPLECFRAARAAFPEDRPVAVRVSASDWIEGGWSLDDTVAFAEALKAEGCDLIHVSSGGISPDQKLEPGPGYQTDFAAEIRRRAGAPTMAVGQITEPLQAETVVRTGQADMVALARGLLWEPRWPWRAAVELGAELETPAPYARANPKVRATPFLRR